MRKILEVVISAILILGLFTGCGTERIAITADEFTKIAEEKGFTVNDDTGEANPEVVEKILIAVKDDAYQVEFYDFKNEDEAESLYEYIKLALETEYSVKTLVKSVSSSNYDYYSFESGDVFEKVIRVGDTLLYSGAKKEYKDSVDEIIEVIGY